MTTLQYRPEIDGLRALAVIPVVLFHAGVPGFSGGFVGVDVFFVISGYLITTILLKEIKADQFSIMSFYERRARRILPALLVVLAVTFPFAYQFMLIEEFRDYCATLIASIFFLSNVVLWRQSGYFGSVAEENPLLHTWSLGVEEQFYLFFPLWLLFVWRFGRRFLLPSLWVFLIGSLLLAELSWRYKPTAGFFLLPTRLWELMAGALAALYHARGFNFQVNRIATWAGFCLVLSPVPFYTAETPFPGLFALPPVLGSLLIILFGTRSTAVGRMLSLRPFVAVGLVSYSLYLWHQPVFAFGRTFMGGALGPDGQIALIALAAFLAWLSWRYVETPFRNRSLVSGRSIARLSIGGAVAVSGMALVGVLGNGLPGRYAPGDRDLADSGASRSEYVISLYNSIRHKKEFAGSGLPRVLLIGDSFSQDFLNILDVAIGVSNLDVVPVHIPSKCQVYFGQEHIDRYIAPKDRAFCGTLSSERALRLAGEAGVVVIASSYLPWAAQRLPDTIGSLRSAGAGRVVVVGKKGFGHIPKLRLLRLTPTERISYRQAAPDSLAEVNRALSRLEERVTVVDMQSQVCGDEGGGCRLFDDAGRLLSYDGHHLTEAGANYFAKKLAFELGLILGSLQARR